MEATGFRTGRQAISSESSKREPHPRKCLAARLTAPGTPLAIGLRCARTLHPGAGVASTDPIGFDLVTSVTIQSVTAPRPGLELRHDDIRRVRLYSRLAAALSSLTLLLLVLAGAWLLGRWVDTPWDGSAGPFIAATFIAAARFARTEAKLRTYDVQLTDDAVTFAYGRRHVYLPIAHLQLIDTESSPLLRPLGLSRGVLHTAGGMVVISPVPIRFVSAIEERMLEQRAGHPDAG